MKYTSFVIFTILLAACTPSNGTIVSIGSPDSFKYNWYRKDLVSGEKSDSVPASKVSVRTNSSYQEEVKKFSVEENRYKVDLSEETKIVAGNRGTVIKIPKNSLVDKNGNPYLGEANISFKEFTNSAEIAFSNIPMTYRSGKDELRFNSAGMFEINATTLTGDELYVGKDKSISVDYKLVKKNPGTDFYRLDKKKNAWIKVSSIIKPGGGTRDTILSVEPIFIWGSSRKFKVEYIDFDTTGWKGQEIPALNYTDGGHAYPDIVKGLSVNRFGVYNCDQAYRLANAVKVNASYVDSKTGEILNDLQSLSLIDLSYIGAFSFDPRQFICNGKGRNALLLFSKNGDLYYMGEEKFKTLQLENDGEYTFRMTNISDKVKSTEDLQKLLNL